MDQILVRMTVQDANVILAALGKQPLADVFDTFVRLRQAMQAATQPAGPQQGEQSVPGTADTTS